MTDFRDKQLGWAKAVDEPDASEDAVWRAFYREELEKARREWKPKAAMWDELMRLIAQGLEHDER